MDSDSGDTRFVIPFPPHNAPRIAFHPRGTRLVIGLGFANQEQGELRLCELTRGQTLARIPLSGSAHCVEFDPTGGHVDGSDETMRLWSIGFEAPSQAERLAAHQVDARRWTRLRLDAAEDAKDHHAQAWLLHRIAEWEPEFAAKEKEKLRERLDSKSLAEMTDAQLKKREGSLSLERSSEIYVLSAEYLARGAYDAHQRMCFALFKRVDATVEVGTASIVFRLGAMGPNAVTYLEASIAMCEAKFTDDSKDTGFALRQVSLSVVTRRGGKLLGNDSP